jgi:plastocyanin
MPPMPRVLGVLSVVGVLLTASACGGGGGDSPTSPAAPSTPSAPVTPPPTTTPPTTTPPTTSGGTEIVANDANQFNPSSLTVARGATVTFTFQSVMHNVIFAAVTGAPANIGNSSNTGVQRVFATAGTFGFDCTLHAGMRGTVIVN